MAKKRTIIENKRELDKFRFVGVERTSPHGAICAGSFLRLSGSIYAGFWTFFYALFNRL